MASFRLVKTGFRFNAIHAFPNDDGYDRFPHGHDYEFAVMIEGPRAGDGMVFDMRRVKALAQAEVVEKLDHTNLNPALPDPSSEALAEWIWQRLRSGIPAHLKLGIQLWETRSIYVEYWGEAGGA